MNCRQRARELRVAPLTARNSFASEVPLFRRRAARALFSGNGLDNEAAALLGIEWDFRPMKRGVHERNNFGIVESGGAFEPDVADDIAAAHETVLGIGDAGALEKTECDVVGIEGDREDGVGRALVGNETDHESVVIVVDHFKGAGEALAHFDEGAAGE